ncbi:MAG: DUF2812 domain-containing protein [Oscillospiraceae bacterium]|nr:DUF2812 domain-containing protein [Oscillospiraceae bacterium]
MADRMTEKNRFTLWEYPQMLQHFEHMAQNGWMLAECNDAQFVYEKSEPKTVHFAATFFPAYDYLDPYPPQKLQRLWDFCADNGWQHITDSASMQIFCSERENPTHVHTDAVVQLENFHNMINISKLKNWRQEAVINGGFIVLLAVVAGVFAKDTSFSVLVSRLSPVALLVTAYYTYKCISAVCGLVSYYSWYKKADTAAKSQNVFITFQPNAVWANIDWAISVFFLCGMAVLLVKSGELGSSMLFSIPFILLFFIIVAAAKLMKNNGVPAKYSRRIIWVIAVLFVLLFVMALPYIFMTIADMGLGGEMITHTINYP